MLVLVLVFLIVLMHVSVCVCVLGVAFVFSWWLGMHVYIQYMRVLGGGNLHRCVQSLGTDGGLIYSAVANVLSLLC